MIEQILSSYSLDPSLRTALHWDPAWVTYWFIERKNHMEEQLSEYWNFSSSWGIQTWFCVGSLWRTRFGVCFEWTSRKNPQIRSKCRLEYFCLFSGLVPDVSTFGVFLGVAEWAAFLCWEERGQILETYSIGTGVASDRKYRQWQRTQSLRGKSIGIERCRSFLVCFYMKRGKRGSRAEMISRCLEASDCIWRIS